MRRMVGAALAAILATAGAAGAVADTPVAQAAARPLDAVERSRVVETLASGLQANFVFPEIGARYAKTLRTRLASGAYDGLTDPDAFAARLTQDLQAVSPDKHLRIASKTALARPRAPAADIPLSARPNGQPGLEEAKMIGDVAYLRFNEFPDAPEAADRARGFLLEHADARAVIIDCRPNRGGGVSVMNAILPLLFARPATQVRMDTRAAAAELDTAPEPNMIRRPSPADLVRYDHVIVPERAHPGLQRVPLYYLTSRRTGSAAEHMALGLKRTRRGVLIGETTAGANHFGIYLPLGEQFTAFLPIGRSYDPATGKDWEGVGVTPDIATPADAALGEALARARAAGAHPGAG